MSDPTDQDVRAAREIVVVCATDKCEFCEPAVQEAAAIIAAARAEGYRRALGETWRFIADLSNAMPNDHEATLDVVRDEICRLRAASGQPDEDVNDGDGDR